MITPPATLGILGGGQLGRYFVMAARTMGYRTIVLEPDPHAPAGSGRRRAPRRRLRRRGRAATPGIDVRRGDDRVREPSVGGHGMAQRPHCSSPSPAAVAIAQDRQLEKAFLRDAGIPVAPFAVIETDADVAGATELRYPAILKTARMGYDGKGQVSVAAHDELAAAWAQLDRQRCVLEQRLRLDGEVSVVLARGADGEIAIYPTAHNTHVDGILDCTVVPFVAPRADELAAQIATVPRLRRRAGRGDVHRRRSIAGQRARAASAQQRALDARRGAHQPVRAAGTRRVRRRARRSVAVGARRGDGQPARRPVGRRRTGLVGGAWPIPRASLHLYGKTSARPGRKMGHITVTAASPEEAERRAKAIRSATDDSVACRRPCSPEPFRPRHGPDRLARSDLQQLVVPAGDLRRSRSSTR